MENLDSLHTARQRWWAPFLSSFGCGSVFFFVLPSILLVALNSRSAMLAMMGAGGLALPWLVARLHWLTPALPVVTFYSVMVLGWVLQPANFDGNPKLALATYLLPWLLVAEFGLAAVSAVLLKRRYAR